MISKPGHYALVMAHFIALKESTGPPAGTARGDAAGVAASGPAILARPHTG